MAIEWITPQETHQLDLLMHTAIFHHMANCALAIKIDDQMSGLTRQIDIANEAVSTAWCFSFAANQTMTQRFAIATPRTREYFQAWRRALNLIF
jgi:hypothetical protein